MLVSTLQPWQLPAGRRVVAFTYRSRLFVLGSVAAALLLVSVMASPAEAQRRSARYRRPVVVIGAYSYPYWAYRSWYGWGQWGPRGYPPYGYPYGYVADVTSALRIDVEPRQAQVFVDGYYAGLVDEFDGVFQRLRVEPGGHVITIYLEGYRTVTQELYLRRGTDQRVRLSLEPLAPGEQAVPPVPPRGDDRVDGGDERDGSVGRPARQIDRPAPPREVRPAVARFGTLALRVQPADADVYVDGERWTGAPDNDRVVIELPEGPHRVEVRKAGLVTFEEQVLIRRERTLTLNVSLRE